jgi:TPR repeat protein
VDSGQLEAQYQYEFYALEHQCIVRHEENVMISVQCAGDYGIAETQFDGYLQFLLKRAAYQRLTEDQFNYGVQVFTDDRISINKSQSACYFEFSADQRHNECQVRDTIRHLTGNRLSINRSQSTCHLKLAVHQRFMIAEGRIVNWFGMVMTFEWTKQYPSTLINLQQSIN